MSPAAPAAGRNCSTAMAISSAAMPRAAGRACLVAYVDPRRRRSEARKCCIEISDGNEHVFDEGQERATGGGQREDPDVHAAAATTSVEPSAHESCRFDIDMQSSVNVPDRACRSAVACACRSRFGKPSTRRSITCSRRRSHFRARVSSSAAQPIVAKPNNANNAMADLEALELRLDDIERFPMITAVPPRTERQQRHPTAFVIHE